MTEPVKQYKVSPRLEIGIDPGTKTGFAVMSHYGVLTDVVTLDFWRAYEAVLSWPPEKVKRVVIELADTSHVWHECKNARQASKVGQNVGRVFREAELLEAGLRRQGYHVETVPPQGTKTINHQMFCRITGWKGQTSEHSRDAALLIYRDE